MDQSSMPNTAFNREVADVRHGSAAGSGPPTSDVAPGSATPRDVSPLGAGNINDDASPAGKSRMTSREPLAPSPEVIPQMQLDGTGNQSLELSSSPDQFSMAEHAPTSAFVAG